MTRAPREAGTAVFNLPVELLLESLRSADAPTRVRATHVSRTWRKIALSDRQLWDSFSCSTFKSQRREDAMFCQLQTMLLRSYPLPFQLRIPHCPFFRSRSEYYARVVDLEHLDVHRLSLYDGPLKIFTQLNEDRTPLPTLTSLIVCDSDSYTFAELDGQFLARTLPNLQRLGVDGLSFPTNNDPHRALQHLTCSVDSEEDYQLLFENFPSLVEVQLIIFDGLTTLPPVLLPQSLRSIVLRPDNCQSLDVPMLLRNWTGEQIARLALQGAHLLPGVLPLFLASHSHNVELRLNSRNDEIELRTMPTDGAAPRTWTITPSRPAGEFLNGLQSRGCERLTSISVAIEQLEPFFAAQLDTPGLKRLEFRLVGTPDELLIPDDDGDYFICAPRLQHVTFTMDGSVSEIRKHLSAICFALDVLHSSFRTLIVYDADLLDSITLSAPTESVLDVACPDFASFTKQYTVIQQV